LGSLGIIPARKGQELFLVQLNKTIILGNWLAFFQPSSYLAGFGQLFPFGSTIKEGIQLGRKGFILFKILGENNPEIKSIHWKGYYSRRKEFLKAWVLTTFLLINFFQFLIKFHSLEI